MTAKTYASLMRVIAVGLAALIAVGIVAEWPVYVPLLAVMAALLIANLARRGVKEVLADERNQRVYEKSAAASYRIYAMVTAAVVLIAMMLRANLPDWVFIASQTLAYSLCALMLLHLAVTRYYEEKL